MRYRTLLIICLPVLFSIGASGQKAVKVDFDRKIADAMPAELPQSPTEKRASTDARDAGVKGKVKSVTHYVDHTREPGRAVHEQTYYDRYGNLLRTIIYDEGYPDSVVVWGFVDGMRVT